MTGCLVVGRERGDGQRGYPITGERKFKQPSTGERAYTYYRCAKYNRPCHPRTRVREEELDQQVLALFDRIRIQDDNVRDWFRAVLASQTRDQQHESQSQREELQRQLTMAMNQQDRLVNLRGGWGNRSRHLFEEEDRTSRTPRVVEDPNGCTGPQSRRDGRLGFESV